MQQAIVEPGDSLEVTSRIVNHSRNICVSTRHFRDQRELFQASGLSDSAPPTPPSENVAGVARSQEGPSTIRDGRTGQMPEVCDALS